MKLRYKILITIGLAVLYFLLQNYAFGSPIKISFLQQRYKDFNEYYFLNQLPKDTEVSYGDSHGQYMGVEFKDATGRYHIVIDKATNPVDRVTQLTLLHEMCHLENDKHGDTTKPEFDTHGVLFQECMLNLAQHGAFRDLW